MKGLRTACCSMFFSSFIRAAEIKIRTLNLVARALSPELSCQVSLWQLEQFWQWFCDHLVCYHWNSIWGHRRGRNHSLWHVEIGQLPLWTMLKEKSTERHTKGKLKNKTQTLCQKMMAHALNPWTQEAEAEEADRFLSSRLVWTTQQVLVQTGYTVKPFLKNKQTYKNQLTKPTKQKTFGKNFLRWCWFSQVLETGM